MAVNIPWMLLLPTLLLYPFSTVDILLLSRSSMPPFVPANRGSIILRIAEFQFTLFVPSFILDRAARFKTKTPNWLCPQYPRIPFLSERITKDLPSKNIFKQLKIYLFTCLRNTDDKNSMWIIKHFNLHYSFQILD